jgi:hypothetical protein
LGTQPTGRESGRCAEGRLGTQPIGRGRDRFTVGYGSAAGLDFSDIGDKGEESDISTDTNAVER